MKLVRLEIVLELNDSSCPGQVYYVTSILDSSLAYHGMKVGWQNTITFYNQNVVSMPNIQLSGAHPS